ncbi:hypothetical protein K438DRAFT_1760983 [Mycena galopus ATCC 62051]|nr:hypothetical protein K438DRAFT_1760983 [Mycena galopus ATCC 62051]
MRRLTGCAANRLGAAAQSGAEFSYRWESAFGGWESASTKKKSNFLKNQHQSTVNCVVLAVRLLEGFQNRNCIFRLASAAREAQIETPSPVMDACLRANNDPPNFSGAEEEIVQPDISGVSRRQESTWLQLKLGRRYCGTGSGENLEKLSLKKFKIMRMDLDEEGQNELERAQEVTPGAVGLYLEHTAPESVRFGPGRLGPRSFI